MTKKLATAAIAAAGLATAGCVGHFDFDEDHGPQTTQDVKLTGFKAVSANGAIDLTITVGAEESIKIEGADERVKNLETSVKEGVLILEDKSQSIFGHSGRLHVTITLPNLEALEINGSGDATVTGIKGGAFAIAINGSGDVDVSGEATECTVTINGSGDVNATDLKAKTATVSISGSGDIDVSVSDALTATIAGSGDITYFGDPKVTKSVMGSGDINKG